MKKIQTGELANTVKNGSLEMRFKQKIVLNAPAISVDLLNVTTKMEAVCAILSLKAQIVIVVQKMHGDLTNAKAAEYVIAVLLLQTANATLKQECVRVCQALQDRNVSNASTVIGTTVLKDAKVSKKKYIKNFA